MCTQGFQLSLSFRRNNSEFLIPYQGKGEKNGRAQLNEAKVRRIRAKVDADHYAETAPKLSKELGVCEKTISLIRRGILWPHVK